MRKVLALVVLAGLSVAAVKFFTDYPNSTPQDSDFFVLQRNQSYVNSSPLQVRTAWFNNPAFTGNGSISGAFGIGGFSTIGGNLTLGGIYYGNGAGITNVSGFATTFTNLTVVSNFFSTTITNTTLNTTNVVIQAPGGFTNLNLTPNTMMYAGPNDVESSLPNAQGVLTNSGTAFGYSMFLSLTEVDAQNFFPTNMFTGKTNFDILGTDGNGKLAAGGSTLSNNLIASLSAALVSATNSLSGNGLGLTNLTYRYTTNNSGTTTLSWSTAYRTNLAANVVVALASPNAAFYETIVYWVTNNSGANKTVTGPSGCIGPVGSGTPSVLTATNNTITRFLFEHYGPSDITVSKTDFGP